MEEPIEENQEEDVEEVMLPPRTRGLIFRTIVSGMIYLSIVIVGQTGFTYNDFSVVTIQKTLQSSQQIKEWEKQLHKLVKKYLPWE